jgi:3-hydroxyisobutyrate dehydrogenase-like beta-hydroxyacid dehydrogenase
MANSMLETVTVAAAELQTAGEAAGLDREEVFWTLTRLAPSLEMRRAGYLDDQHEPALFAVRDLRKDLDITAVITRYRPVTAARTVTPAP